MHWQHAHISTLQNPLYDKIKCQRKKNGTILNQLCHSQGHQLANKRLSKLQTKKQRKRKAVYQYSSKGPLAHANRRGNLSPKASSNASQP